MINDSTNQVQAKHLRITQPSPWVARFSPTIPSGGVVLDLACGGGRHSAHLLDHGYKVCALDKDTEVIAKRLAGQDNFTLIKADLETEIDPFGVGGCLSGQLFDGIVVVNYLYRPLMASLIYALKPGGVLIYETFARGNEVYARPRNPDHLLCAGELLELFAGHLQVIAYEHGVIQAEDLPGVKQRLVAVHDLGLSERNDGDPPTHSLQY